MLAFNSGIGVLQYSAFGLGKYPYRYSMPGAGMRVRINNVPLRSLSPFGPDFELIPSQLVDSFECSGMRDFNIITKSGTEDEPVTMTRFLLGSRRRFNFNMSFSQSIGEKSGVFFAGSSSGIHGNETSEKNALRNYFLKYHHLLDNGGTVNLFMWVFRDRDGLVDLDKKSHMGERKTDTISFSLGLDTFPVSERTTVSPVIYYQSGYSRFERYGYRKSLDDNAGGLNVTVSTKRGNTEYGLYASHDITSFYSRIHRDFWTRNESELIPSLKWNNDKYRVKLNGGLKNSSEYGIGSKIDGELALIAAEDKEVVIHGVRTDEFPDAGQEYYPSLVFSDTTLVSHLRRYSLSELEVGLRCHKKHYNIELFGFASYSETPVFTPSSIILNVRVLTPFPLGCGIQSKKKSSGYRINVDAYAEKRYRFDMKIHCTVRPNGHRNWPYPSAEVSSELKMSGTFLNENINSSVFTNAEHKRWNDGDSAPYGNYLFFNCGLIVKVSTLELFYRIENITSEEIEWFNVMGWQGRNSMWGVQWTFKN